MSKHGMAAVALILLSASSANAQLSEQREFACDASVGTAHYHLQLSRSGVDAHMRVRDDQQIIADGPAISYRSGTRYFVATGPNTGIKLTIDRDPARICFGAGGSDCHTCAVPPKPAHQGVAQFTCSRDDYQLTAITYRTAPPDIVVTDARGAVLASGPGSFWGRRSDHFTLPVGPSEHYEVDDAVDACTNTGLPEPDPTPPDILDSRCRTDVDDWEREFELHHAGDQTFAVYYYGDGGFITGPISMIEGDRYLLFGGFNATVTYRVLTDTTGEICDGSTCATCTFETD